MNNKKFHVQENIGTVKYLVSYHDGCKKHRDGSAFYDIAIFKNKKKLASFISELRGKGYVEAL
jgi:hypothetical protein